MDTQSGHPGIARGTRARRAVGVDVGGTKILAGVVDETGAVLRSEELATPDASQAGLLATLERLVASLVADGADAIGVGVPSRIDQRAGRAVSSTNLPLVDVWLRDLLRERFGLPVGVDNDANVAALAEWRLGAGRGTRTMVMVTLGTGVGGGLIVDGRPFRGATGGGAEIGHMVLEHDGAPCQGSCTGRGHAETLVSGSAADAAAEALYGPGSDARLLVTRAHAGDAEAVAALRAIGCRLGSLIASLANLFDPEVVVVGGGFGSEWDELAGPATEVFRRDALTPMRDTVLIAPAELGTAAGLVGAALVGLEAADAPDGSLL